MLIKAKLKTLSKSRRACCDFSFDCSKFINALTVFIWEKRKMTDDKSITVENEQYKQEIDSNWVKNYFIDIYKFITCWKQEDKDFTNLNFKNEKKVRCVSHWREKNKWRKNCMWIQKTDSDNDYKTTDFGQNNDRRIKQSKFMIIVLDHERIKTDEKSREYIKVFIERLNWVIDEKSNIIHDMFEARVSSKNKSKKFRKLDHRRFYDLCNIIRNVHLVSMN